MVFKTKTHCDAGSDHVSSLLNIMVGEESLGRVVSSVSGGGSLPVFLPDPIV